MEDDSFYVRIPEHVEFRRNLLLSSRSLIEMLKQSEKISEIRAEKVNHIAELRMIIEEIVILNSRLKSTLPKTKFKKTPFKNLPKLASPKKTGRGNIEMLQSELNKIESRLSEIL